MLLILTFRFFQIFDPRGRFVQVEPADGRRVIPIYPNPGLKRRET